MILDIDTVEELVLDFMNNSELSKGAFSVAAVAAFIKEKTGKPKDENPEGLDEKIEEVLESEELLFKNPVTGEYTGKDLFFKGARFIVVPSAEEIDAGVFIPGHRLQPFCNDMVFASEAVISAGGETLRTRDYREKVEKLVPYHYLMGVEMMMDYFIADDPANTDVIRGAKPSDEITIQAFDFSKFYKTREFKAGDTLLFTVVDRFGGQFSVEPFKKAFTHGERELWFETFQNALGKVCDHFQDYMDIPEQMAQAFFLGGKKLFDPPAMGVEEFMATSDEIRIVHSGGHSVLARVGGGPGEPSSELPDGVTISCGNVDSVDDILKEAGSFLKPIHLESYMLDELFNERDSFELLRERCFGERPLRFRDEAQEAVFMNFFEEMWETIKDAYPDYKDSRKGLARSRALELVDEMTDWFSELEDSDKAKKVPQDLLKRLSECSAHVCNLLALLNNPKSEFDDDNQYDSTLDSIDELEEIQSSLMEDIARSIVEKK